MHTTEEVLFDQTSGALITNSTWEYKVPSHKDIPIDIRVTLLKNSNNPYGVLSSKVVGEPPLTLSCVVLFALKKAILVFRAQSGSNGNFNLSSPATVENVQLNCSINMSQFVLK